MSQDTYVLFYRLDTQPFTYVHALLKGKGSFWLTVSTSAFYWFPYFNY
jgi:hypothetical protein